MLFRDWWDDFDRDRPSRLLDQHFGLGLRRDDLLNNWPALAAPVIRPGSYFRPWGQLFNRPSTGSSSIKATDKEFQVILDVQQFAPHEITVKITDGAVLVEGKHEEKQDEHGYVSRHFVRRYVLPKEVDPENVISNLSSDGVLTINVPKKIALAAGERVVPIRQTGLPAVKAASLSPNETQIKVEHEMH